MSGLGHATVVTHTHTLPNKYKLQTWILRAGAHARARAHMFPFDRAESCDRLNLICVCRKETIDLIFRSMKETL